jgi:hypothetical protein
LTLGRKGWVWDKCEVLLVAGRIVVEKMNGCPIPSDFL